MDEHPSSIGKTINLSLIQSVSLAPHETRASELINDALRASCVTDLEPLAKQREEKQFQVEKCCIKN